MSLCSCSSVARALLPAAFDLVLDLILDVILDLWNVKPSLVGRDRLIRGFVFEYGIQSLRISSKRAGTEQIILCRDNQRRILNRAAAALGNLEMLVVARHQIDARNIVPGNHTLDFIKDRQRIEWSHFRLEIVRFEPDYMPVRFS